MADSVPPANRSGQSCVLPATDPVALVASFEAGRRGAGSAHRTESSRPPPDLGVTPVTSADRSATRSNGSASRPPRYARPGPARRALTPILT